MHVSVRGLVELAQHFVVRPPFQLLDIEDPRPLPH